MAVTYPRLSIVDAAWTSAAGNTSSDYVVNTKALFASTDPVAVSWYAAKYMLTPVAYNKTETNPDLLGGKYHDCLTNWKNFLVDSADKVCTMDSTKISVYNRRSLIQKPLPVQLVSFDANLNNDGVELKWKTNSEINNYGFYVERQIEDEQKFTEVKEGFIPGHGTTLEPQSYSFIDNSITEVGTYYYRLRQVDNDGLVNYSSPVSISISVLSVNESILLTYKLEQNYPNPFNPSTTIKYGLPEQAHVTLTVHNTLGQRVATLVNEKQNEGYHKVVFNNPSLPNGVYFYRLQAGTFTDTKKLLLIK
jgi:hypothetical protein